jgi:hypothetical protein
MPFGAVLATQGALGLHIMGAPVDGHVVGGHGHFIYFGDRLKVDHLDAKGVTLPPEALKEFKTEEAQPAATPAPSDKK